MRDRRRFQGHSAVAVAALRADPGPLLALTAVAVLIAVGSAQAGDLLTFLRMIAVAGIGAELNPIVARGAGSVGLAALVVAKVALVVLVVSAFFIVAPRHARIAGAVATCGVLAGLVGAYSNVLAIT